MATTATYMSFNSYSIYKRFAACTCACSPIGTFSISRAKALETLAPRKTDISDSFFFSSPFQQKSLSVLKSTLTDQIKKKSSKKTWPNPSTFGNLASKVDSIVGNLGLPKVDILIVDTEGADPVCLAWLLFGNISELPPTQDGSHHQNDSIFRYWVGGRPKAYHIHIQLYFYLYIYIFISRGNMLYATYDKYRRGKVYSSNRKYRREIYTQVIPSVSVFFSKMAWCQISEICWHPAGALIMEVLKIPPTTATKHVGKHPRIQQWHWSSLIHAISAQQEGSSTIERTEGPPKTSPTKPYLSSRY